MGVYAIILFFKSIPHSGIPPITTHTPPILSSATGKRWVGAANGSLLAMGGILQTPPNPPLTPHNFETPSGSLGAGFVGGFDDLESGVDGVLLSPQGLPQDEEWGRCRLAPREDGGQVLGSVHQFLGSDG